MSLHTDYEAVKRNGGIIDLSHRVKLAFTGADRVRYLNGQITARLDGRNGVLPTCVTTAKGKLCADVFVSTWQDYILLDADAAVADSLPARMEKYIVADDVALADFSAKTLLHCIGIAPAQIAEITQAMPSTRFGISGCDIQPFDHEAQPAIWEKLTARFAVVSEELAEVLRIEAGIPRWGFELNENTLPAEAGLDRTHVDFKKGCYIGQEVISRIKSVGHVNRALLGFLTPNRELLSPGSRISSMEDPAKNLGIITSAADSPALNRPIALGYLHRSAPNFGLMASAPDAPDAPVPIEITTLPFQKQN